MKRYTSLSFIFFFTLAFSTNLFSQENKDTILLLNGDAIICTVIDTTKGVTSIKDPKSDKRNIIIDNDRIFSIRNEKGESVMYVYDTVLGNEFTLDEMRYFMIGEHDADKGFKGNGAMILGGVVGLASGLTGSFFSLIPPFGFAALSGLPKVKIKHSTVSNIELLKEPSYIMGYERVARKKRKIRSLISGGIGVGVGLGTILTLQKTNPELF